jgi:uncharacterized membrane protein
MAESKHSNKKKSRVKQFFFRGLGILLPTVLTLWILVTAYKFVEEKIAQPINKGVRQAIVLFTPWPHPLSTDYEAAEERLKDEQPEQYAKWVALQGKDPDRLEPLAKSVALERQWQYVGVGEFALFDLLGFLVAFVIIYVAGALLGSFIGRNLYRRGEELLAQIPLVKQVYPHVKQVTDFLVGGSSDPKMQFNRVVAIEYPRKGLWSIGLVTGDTMNTIQLAAKTKCISVFIPSSPTPFTGYVITIAEIEAIDLDVSIDEALKFTISGGVIVPPSEIIDRAQLNPDNTTSRVPKLQTSASQDDIV